MEYQYEAKKLDNGYVTVRDYNLNDCNNNGCDLLIKYKDQKMIIPHSKLKERALKIDKTIFNSYFDNRKYGIYHFRWEPIINPITN